MGKGADTTQKPAWEQRLKDLTHQLIPTCRLDTLNYMIFYLFIFFKLSHFWHLKKEFLIIVD